MRVRLLLFVLAIITCMSCTLGPDYKRRDISAPEHWRMSTDEAHSLANLSWWKLFEDETLQELIRAAIEGNKDLMIAAARIEEALAYYGFTRADLFPHVDGSASDTRSRSSEYLSLPGAQLTRSVYTLSLNVTSYEIDLWGRLRRLTESARAQVLASEEARKTVYISLVSNVSQAYLELRDLDQQKEIADRTLKARKESLRLARARFENGLVSALDVYQAESSVERARDAIADIERQIFQKENALSILLGKNPGSIPRGKSLTAQVFPIEVPAGLPSDLIERRPDILQAEQLLIAANANIGAAKAALFPRITLTGLLGYESTELSKLFTGSARTWQFIPQATVPLFNAGKNLYGVEIAESQQKNALIQYEQTVQRAFREVEDALIEHKKRSEQREAQEKLVAAERNRLRLSELRYRNGIVSYSEVLDAQGDLLNAELTLSQTIRVQFVAIVQLYKALGGGWHQDEHSK